MGVQELLDDGHVMVMCIAVQSEALEHSLMAALPLGPQSAAGGVSLPDSFHGELTVIPIFHFLPAASFMCSIRHDCTRRHALHHLIPQS